MIQSLTPELDSAGSAFKAAEAPACAASAPPLRSAWVEVDLRKFRSNLELITRELPPGVGFASVLKDDAYGHGALALAPIVQEFGARFIALSTLDEALALRKAGVTAPILLLGDRPEAELPWCVSHDLTCCLGNLETARKLAVLAAGAGKRVPVHIKINTGMNRYGARWTEAALLAEKVQRTPGLLLEGVMSHFAQSDEADKTYANLQISRFNEALQEFGRRGIRAGLRHLCNSGGFLDLQHAHMDMVRIGILPLGVFPSSVCRRIKGIEPVMTVKARIAAIQFLEQGDCVGYGMRYIAPGPRRIAVIAMGYGDGFPRVRNQGAVLIHGKRAPLIGGVAMDAFTIDITDIPEARLGDEAVLMGGQGEEEISVHEVAKLAGSVSYHILANWRSRLPRVYLS